MVKRGPPCASPVGGTVGPRNLCEKWIMKKFLTAGLVAAAWVLASHQHASAWVNFKAGIGLNVEWQSGGNSFLWGAVRGAQPPGPQCFGYGPAPYGQPMVADAMPSYYDAPQQDYYLPHPAPAPGWTPPAPQPGWT